MKTEETTFKQPAHQGRNIKRLREMLGIKQESLAEQLGISQQTISRVEGKQEIDDELLAKIAQILKIPVEVIRDFDENMAINIISNTYQDESISYAYAYKCTFNPLEKVVELYERILAEKDGKIARLEKALENKK